MYGVCTGTHTNAMENDYRGKVGKWGYMVIDYAVCVDRRQVHDVGEPLWKQHYFVPRLILMELYYES